MTEPVSKSKHFSVNLDRMLSDDSKPLNPLSNRREIDVRLVEARNGYAQLSVVLPVEMTRHFAELMESMSGLFRCSDRKARLKLSSQRVLDADQHAKNKADRKAYSERICALFDDFIGQGLTRNEAISRTNSSLKEQKHPWASYDLVKQTLRDSGRFRKQK